MTTETETINAWDAVRIARVNVAIERQIERSFRFADVALAAGNRAGFDREYANALALSRLMGGLQYQQFGIPMWREL